MGAAPRTHTVGKKLAGKYYRNIIHDISKGKSRIILKFVVYFRDALEWCGMESTGSLSASVIGRSSMVLKVPASRTPYFLLLLWISSPKLSHFAECGVFQLFWQRGSKCQQIGLQFQEGSDECYIWSIALYDAETLSLRKVDEKCLGSVEMWCW